MAKRKLTTFSKIIITVSIVAAIVLGIRFLVTSTSLGSKLDQIELDRKKEQEQNAKEKALKQEQKRLAKEEADKQAAEIKKQEEEAARQAELNKTQLRVQLFDNGSAIPGIYFNKGWFGNEESRFFKEFGFKVEFVLYNNLDAAMDAWEKDEFDVMIHSIDEMTTFAERWKDDKPQVFMQVDWSRGDLALIANSKYKNVNDLDNQRVALRRGSASETFMQRALEASGMSGRDINFSGIERNEAAYEKFNSNNAQAFVVPTNEPEALARKMNANLLQTTKEASHVVARCFVVKKDFLNEKKNIINQFYKAWMTAVSEINNDRNAYETAAYIYAKDSRYTEQQVLEVMDKVRIASHEDNKNFFGLNGSYTGIKAEGIYKDMGKIYAASKLAPSARPRWKSIINMDAINNADKELKGENFGAESDKDFSTISEPDANRKAFSTKPLIINFSPGSAKLSASAQSFIDVKIRDLLQTYANAQVRIEGNVASTGNPENDQQLSEDRASAVVSYLIEKYDYDPNRFIIKGNGSTNPVKGCESLPSDACKAKNRRMEFMFLGD